MLDDLLKKLNLKYEDLNVSERETMQVWLEQLSKREVTLSDIILHVLSMKEAVEQELINTEEYLHLFFFKIANRKQILLKARLKNYMLIEAFLSTPEKAKRALEAQISAIVRTKEAVK